MVQVSPFLTQSRPRFQVRDPHVGAGDDPVPDAGPVPVPQVDRFVRVGVHLAGGDAFGTRPRVEGGDIAGGGGDQHRRVAGEDVGGPGVIGGLEHRLAGAGPDPVVCLVKLEARRVATPQRQRRGRFDWVGEPAELVEVDGADLGLQEPQRAAGLDRGELRGIAEEPHHRTRVLGERDQIGQLEGAGHAGLVDQDHVTGREPEPRVDSWDIASFAAAVEALLVEELVQILGAQFELVTEDLGSLGAGRERNDPAAVSRPHVGEGAHCGGLPRPRRPDPQRQQGGISGEVVDQPPLPVIQNHAGGGLMDGEGGLRHERCNGAAAGDGRLDERLLGGQDPAGGVSLGSVRDEH
jgi:hypothetical protein